MMFNAYFLRVTSNAIYSKNIRAIRCVENIKNVFLNFNPLNFYIYMCVFFTYKCMNVCVCVCVPNPRETKVYAQHVCTHLGMCMHDKLGTITLC